jgi:protein MAK11
MTLVAGSYEKYILGWRLKQKKKKNNEEEEVLALNPYSPTQLTWVLSNALQWRAHVLVTGGMDDTIKIFDLASYYEMGSLLQHTTAITSMCFYGDESSVKLGGSTCPRNLLSGSLDGNICIWDSYLWVHLKTLKAHKKGVNDLSIHPSGRLALSVGRDHQLSMFDLIKGRCTFKSNLQKEATAIEFNSKGGDIYSMVIEDLYLFTMSRMPGCFILCITRREYCVLLIPTWFLCLFL